MGQGVEACCSRCSGKVMFEQIPEKVREGATWTLDMDIGGMTVPGRGTGSVKAQRQELMCLAYREQERE